MVIWFDGVHGTNHTAGNRSGFGSQPEGIQTDRFWLLGVARYQPLQNTMDIESLLDPILLNWSEIALILGATGKHESGRNSSSLPTNYPCHLL
jgi:hypothetical protein